MTEVLIALISALFGGGVGGAVVRGHFKRRETQDARTAAVLDHALQALGQLDAIYRGVADGQTDVSALTAQEVQARTAVDKCADHAVSDAFDQWATEGRAFASGDLDTGEEAYTDLLPELRRLLREYGRDLSSGDSHSELGS